MDDWASIQSLSSTPIKNNVVNIFEQFKKNLIIGEQSGRKIPFKSLFATILIHLGRLLFHVVVTISGFFPTLVILSHIGGFILERWLEILYTPGIYVRFKKITVTALQVAILLAYCYFLLSLVYAPLFFVVLNFFSFV